jgi:3-phenylpropionate/trans-cinnamate dioxygenase ferredoxin reductase subunit
VQKLVIIGASHAGLFCAEQLRSNGFDGDITIIDRLAGMPLERPALSKAFLQAADADDTKFLLRRDNWFSAQNVKLVDGRSVIRIDVTRQAINLDDGSSHAYDWLVVATGAVPRQLAAATNMNRVFVLRDPDDARAIRKSIPSSKRAIVIGGGYIGLEAAASMVKAGLEVHVIEMADRLLPRVASPQISVFFTDLHNSHNVQIHTGQTADKILSDDSGFTGVRLGNGLQLGGDLLLVGIGVVPDVCLAKNAGLAVDNGILVDDLMQSSVANIYAIGDVARRMDAALRIESVDNAQTSAAVAAAAICDVEPPTIAAPWFWSEQFDVRLQSAGIVPTISPTLCHVIRPGKRTGCKSVWSYDDGILKAVEAVRDPAAYMLGKKCLDLGISPLPAHVADASFDLKAFVAAGDNKRDL